MVVLNVISACACLSACWWLGLEAELCIAHICIICICIKYDCRLHISLQITLRPLVIQLTCMLCSLRKSSAGKQFADVCVVIWLATDVCVVIWLALPRLFATCLSSFNCLPDFVHTCMSMPCHAVHGQCMCHFPVSSQALPCLQSRCTFPARPSSPNKHCMVLQGLGVTVPQLALPPQKLLRTLAPALCTLQYHLCLASTAVLPTHQAAASLTSLVLLPWVCTLHRLLPRHVLAICAGSKIVHCKCCLFQIKAFINHYPYLPCKMHAFCLVFCL